jgi:hypothetical protein
MKRLFLIFTIIISQISSAGSESIPLQCREAIAKAENTLILVDNHIEFKISDPQSTCESSFEYEYLKSAAPRYLITSWPENGALGINAQRNLYIAWPDSSEAKYIGSLPVDAEVLKEGKYRRVSQEGGGIYETIYFIQDDRVNIEKPSKELVVANTECIYSHDNDDSCQRMTGTFDDPICVYSHDGEKTLTEISDCSGLLNFE